jgi:DNA-binding transcriptional MerR regulator
MASARLYTKGARDFHFNSTLTQTTVTVKTVTVKTGTDRKGAVEDTAKPEGVSAPEAAKEYTIDELAAVTRVPSRTIRFYQSAGALPRPNIRGRVAWYDDRHVERLKLVATLQDRGLTIKAIRDVLAQAEKGEFSMREWLGLHEELRAPWVPDQPRLITEAELGAMVKDQRPGLVADLSRLKVIERRGETYFIPSPTLLEIGLRLERAGVGIDFAEEATGVLRKHLARSADELAALFVRRADTLGDDLRAAYEELKPAAIDAVRVLFAREMEEAIRKVEDTGAASALRRKRRAKKT